MPAQGFPVDRCMKVTPVQYGKFKKQMHTYLWKIWEPNPHISVSVSPFPLSTTDPSSDVEEKPNTVSPQAA